MTDSSVTPETRKPFQDQLANTVFLASFLGIVAIGAVVIWSSTSDDDVRDKVFAAVVPLFGTWVGTILAFYFARENFDSANANVRRLVERLTPDQQLAQISVRQAMKPLARLDVLNASNPDVDLSVRQIKELVDKGNSRVPILSDQRIKYVIHESTLNKYLADVLSRGTPATPIDLSKTRISEFLAFKFGDEDVKQIVSKFGVVSVNASLRDARDAMLKIKGAQDVFVTQTGAPTEKIEGWLTNTDITRDINF